MMLALAKRRGLEEVGRAEVRSVAMTGCYSHPYGVM